MERIHNTSDKQVTRTTMNNYQEYKKIKADQEAVLKPIEDKLSSYPRGEMGLVSEHIRLSPEYIQIKAMFKAEFQKLQAINKEGTKRFKKEILAEVIAKRKKGIDSYLDIHKDPVCSMFDLGFVYWWGQKTMGSPFYSEECRNARLLGIAFMLTMPEDMIG